MTIASRPRQSLLDLFDPLSSTEKVQQSGEEERSSPTPSAESGSDKENICTAMPRGTPKTGRAYDDKCSETVFFKRTTSRIKAPEHPDVTRESFSVEPGSDASNLCLVELANELDNVCSLVDDSVQNSVARREPLTEIAIPQTNHQTPPSISRAHKNLISLDTPKYTPKSRSLSLKFAAGISSCDGLSPKPAYSPATSSGKSTPRQNLLSPSITITTPIDHNLRPTYKSITPPLRPLFSSSSSTSEHEPSTPRSYDSSPRFQDPPSSLGRGVGNISSASLDIQALGARLDFSNDLLKDEPSLLDKMDNDSFSSDFDFPKSTIERIGSASAPMLDGEDDVVVRRSSSITSSRSSTSHRSRSKTPMSRSDVYHGQLSDSSEDEAISSLSRKLSSSSISSDKESTKNRNGAPSRRSSIYETDGINLLDEELDDKPVLRSASVLSSRNSVPDSSDADLLVEDLDNQLQKKRSSLISSHIHRGSLHKKDDSEDEERDDFDLKTYTAPKPVSTTTATSRAISRPRISNVVEAKPLTRSQSLSRRTSMTIAPPPSTSSLRTSTLSRPSLSRRSSIGVNLDKQLKGGFDMSVSQGREDKAPKLKSATTSIASAAAKRLTTSLSVSTMNGKEGAFGTTGRMGSKTIRAAPPSAFGSSTLGRSTASKAGLVVANSESRATNTVVARSSAGSTLERRSSIGLASSLSKSTTGSTFRRTSSVPTLPPLSQIDASVTTARRPLTRTTSIGTERSNGVSRLTSTAARAVRRLPTTSEHRAL